MKQDKRKKNIIGFIAIAWMMTACAGAEEEYSQPVLSTGDETLDYSYAECVYGDVEETERVRCEYKKYGEQEVYFPTSGKVIANVYVREGDGVKEGDVLAELDVDGLKSGIAELEYRIKRNELLLKHLDVYEALDAAELYDRFMLIEEPTEEDRKAYEDRLNALKQSNAFTRNDYKDQLEFDRLKLQSMEEEYEGSSVRAEFDGRVKSIANNLLGSTTNVEKCIMTIVDDSEGYFETEAGALTAYIQAEDQLTLKVVSGDGKGEYHVSPMDMDGWGDKQQFRIVSGDHTMGLEAGNTGELYIVTARREAVLTLPTRCIHPAGEDTYVYIVNDEGRRDVVWVKTGAAGSGVTEIVEGLHEGDRVIL